MTTLIFVRHGQSESNLAKIFTGQKETLLTELGHLQAECTAEYLADRRIDRIYSSDLRRVIQTAEPTARRQGLEIIPRAELREIDAGLWEGKLYDDIRAEFPESYGLWLSDIGRSRPDGGESVAELAHRIYAEVDRIVQENHGKCVAIFTHAIPLRTLGCRWQGLPPEEAAKISGCSNASVSVVEYEDDGSFRLVAYGYDRHQGDHATTLPRGLV